MPKPRLIEIEAAPEIGVQARILDLFTAIDWLPNSYSCRRVTAGVQLHLDIGELPEARRQIIVAKLARVDGVRRVVETPAP
ncbi:hypothetical protein KX816_04560 [Sphingosinicellaceae bacterium]|nr:hypothetical protein KX816_04560 [Sphingosinicellaceae bacterium]